MTWWTFAPPCHVIVLLIFQWNHMCPLYGLSATNKSPCQQYPHPQPFQRPLSLILWALASTGTPPFFPLLRARPLFQPSLQSHFHNSQPTGALIFSKRSERAKKLLRLLKISMSHTGGCWTGCCLLEEWRRRNGMTAWGTSLLALGTSRQVGFEWAQDENIDLGWRSIIVKGGLTWYRHLKDWSRDTSCKEARPHS